MMTVFCITTGLVCTLSFHAVCQIIDQSGQHDLKTLCLSYKSSNDHLSMFHTFKPSIIFYTGRPVDSFFRSEKLLLTARPTNKRLLIFVHDQFLPILQSIPNLMLKPLSQQGPWQVLLAENATLNKQATLENIFRNTQAISETIDQSTIWGPLTVPYAAGN